MRRFTLAPQVLAATVGLVHGTAHAHGASWPHMHPHGLEALLALAGIAVIMVVASRARRARLRRRD